MGTPDEIGETACLRISVKGTQVIQLGVVQGGSYADRPISDTVVTPGNTPPVTAKRKAVPPT